MAEPDLTEEWRPVPIPEFAEAYSVSNLGRVRQELRRGGTRPGLILAGGISDGYLNVTLSYSGRQRTAFVHQLVAAVFVGATPEGLEIDHRDGNKLNNRAPNFRFVTSGENSRAAASLGLMCHGERCHSAVFQEADVRAIRARAESGESIAAIARALDVTPRAILKIVRRLSWKHVV